MNSYFYCVTEPNNLVRIRVGSRAEISEEARKRTGIRPVRKTTGWFVAISIAVSKNTGRSLKRHHDNNIFIRAEWSRS